MRFAPVLAVLLAACGGEPDAPPERRMTNRLAREKSPYLLQHANNPVDWYPWGEEAFEKARREEKPIFLSIGYSSCHWCHVMEHESFADPEIAKILNEHFVPVKVDREERPDIDDVYMNAVTAMGVGGGWPLSAWLTPDGRPFTGGTYFPPEDAFGRPSFRRILLAVKEWWDDPAKREELRTRGARVAEFLAEAYGSPGGGELKPDALAEARRSLDSAFDAEHGGFGAAPKFPSPSTLEFALRLGLRGKDGAALSMVVTTLRKMALGGIHDHVGGGFHRYSTTRDWLVPHFEKMLYDNAQLLGLYSWAFLATKEELFASTARDIARWVAREMTDPAGGFYSAQDADDPGGPEGEGGFYVWTPEGLSALFPAEEAEKLGLWLDVKPGGNWHEKPGKSILQRVRPSEEAAQLLSRALGRMYAEREKRPKPMTDTKVLADWNALMISGLCRAWQALGEKPHLDAAVKAGEFLTTTLLRDGRIVRRWRDGEAAHGGVLDDYAFSIQALLDLYESTLDRRWLSLALALGRTAVDLFHDPEKGAWFFTAKDGERLIARGKNGFDQARPSGNGVMAMNDLRIAEMTGDASARSRAQGTFDFFGARVAQTALGSSALLSALDFSRGGVRQVFLAGKRGDPALEALARAVWRDPDPHRVLALAEPGVEEMLPPAKGKTPVGGRAAAYVCRDFACLAPVTDPAALSPP
jgi:hypothetical protein